MPFHRHRLKAKPMTKTTLMRTDQTTALATVGDDDPFSTYADAIAPRYIIGTLLRFSKGDFLLGEEKALVPVGSVFTAHVGEMLAGWVRWSDGKVIEHLMARVADNRPLPRRSDLGFTDEAKWETDSKGARRDPWQFTNYLPLMNDSGELATFATASRGGLGAIADLCRRYGRHRKYHPDELPMIALDVGSYQHPNKEYGRIKFPRFIPKGYGPKSKFDEALAAAGYAASETPAPPLEPADNELGDKIRF
jgi:hypothetical protein